MNSLIKKSRFYSALIIFLFFIHSLGICQSKWELRKNENGIKVYTRSVPGIDIQEFKAISDVNVDNIHQIVDKLIDIATYPSWMSNCSSATLIQKNGKIPEIVHMTTDIPWPLNDRDIVFDYNVVTYNDSLFTVKLSPSKKTVPLVDEVIRITNAKGGWKLIKKDTGTVTVIYQFYGEPGGYIPSWVVNMFIVDGPFTTLTNLKEMFD
ncbi:MAG: hypothetical protein MI922_27245 [Bacteroidales bacterium]|nr:hypothetical protein [Bacteroidales bacterium]